MHGIVPASISNTKSTLLNVLAECPPDQLSAVVLLSEDVRCHNCSALTPGELLQLHSHRLGIRFGLRFANKFSVSSYLPVNCTKRVLIDVSLQSNHLGNMDRFVFFFYTKFVFLTTQPKKKSNQPRRRPVRSRVCKD